MFVKHCEGIGSKRLTIRIVLSRIQFGADDTNSCRGFNSVADDTYRVAAYSIRLVMTPTCIVSFPRLIQEPLQVPRSIA